MKVLLGEDSQTVIAYVTRILRGAPDIELLAPATDGLAVVEAARHQCPDVILLDLELPKLHGLRVIRLVMATCPTPIVVLNAHVHDASSDFSFECFEAGAVEVVPKPSNGTPTDLGQFGARLVTTLRIMSQVRVIRRIAKPSGSLRTDSGAMGGARRDVVVLGGSTGAPPALFEILKSLPRPLRSPVLVTQHILEEHERNFAKWLAGAGHPVLVATGRERPADGTVYLSPAHGHLALGRDALEVRPRGCAWPVPSVDVLFSSACEVRGKSVIGVLLTGMGEDGARGLKMLREHGALTIAQSAETCVIDGMPGAARRLGACEFSLPPSDIGELIRTQFGG